MENQARFSSSAVDASYFIMQIGTFWKNLEWPVAAEAYGYLCTIIEVSCRLVWHEWCEVLVIIQL